MKQHAMIHKIVHKTIATFYRAPTVELGAVAIATEDSNCHFIQVLRLVAC